MDPHSAIFTLPRDSSVIVLADALVAGSKGIARAQATARVRARRELLDSFDWRLFEAGLMLEWQCEAQGASLRLFSRARSGARHAAPLAFATTQRPRGLADLPAASIRRRLAPLLDVRALLVQAEQRGALQRVDLFDLRDKVIARVELWQMPRAHTLLVRVIALRGFEPAAAEVAQQLGALSEATPAVPDPIWTRAQRQAVPPGAYPSWTTVAIDGVLRTDDGLQQVLRHYARIMRLNIAGMREHLDPEFLHDFRVGLRRTRTLLRRVPGVFAPARLRPHLDDLAWLGRESTITRDADVHALVFPDYATSLSEPRLAAALAPIWVRVQQEREAAHARLGALLGSARFERRWAAWERFLERPAPRASRQPHGPTALRAVAAKAIRKAARRVRRAGARIDADSPPELYHELRKDCKKLRYLIDAFRDVVHIKGLGKAIRRLKALQDVLGDYQDLDVHRDTLMTLYETTARDGELGPDTHAAMQQLLAELSARSTAARARFADGFTAFLAVRFERAVRPEGR